MITIVKNKETEKRYMVINYGKVFNSETNVAIFKELDVEDAEIQILSKDKFKAQFEKVNI